MVAINAIVWLEDLCSPSKLCVWSWKLADRRTCDLIVVSLFSLHTATTGSWEPNQLIPLNLWKTNMGDKRNDKFMKFGPDWLHNLSQDNNNPVTTASTTSQAGSPAGAAAALPAGAPKPRGPTVPPNNKDKDVKDVKDPKDFKELKDFKNNNNRCRLADHR